MQYQLSSFLQDQKNSWQSAEELRKYKDNREKQNSVWKQEIDELKCNIQKESKMMSVAGQPPIITHTAATPQDSPNTTLDVSPRPVYALSIESIDRSGVRYFISIKRHVVYARDNFFIKDISKSIFSSLGTSLFMIFKMFCLNFASNYSEKKQLFLRI